MLKDFEFNELKQIARRSSRKERKPEPAPRRRGQKQNEPTDPEMNTFTMTTKKGSRMGVIEKVRISLLSSEEIDKMSICDLSTKPNAKCLTDPIMGSTDRSEKCSTCGAGYARCDGHFAQMSIPAGYYFPHPWYTNNNLISAICNLFDFVKFSKD